MQTSILMNLGTTDPGYMPKHVIWLVATDASLALCEESLAVTMMSDVKCSVSLLISSNQSYDDSSVYTKETTVCLLY